MRGQHKPLGGGGGGGRGAGCARLAARYPAMVRHVKIDLTRNISGMKFAVHSYFYQ